MFWKSAETRRSDDNCSLLFSVCFATMPLAMSNYQLKPIIPPSLLAQEKKAARKKLLEEVRAKRAENYKRFLQEQKRRLQADSEMI